MNSHTIKIIQKQITGLFRPSPKYSRGVLLTDTCSEVARLVGGWIKKLHPHDHISILKGVNICGTKKSHDIILVQSDNQLAFALDPTIWQFFPQSKKILIAATKKTNQALKIISKKYGGMWAQVDTISATNSRTERQYLKNIRLTIAENIKLLTTK